MSSTADVPAPLGRAARLRVSRSGATSFLGRERELAELRDALGSARLVTLTGPPGIGKTRLAFELADRDHPDAARVELAPIAEGSAVARALASALSVQEVPGRELVEAVVGQLARRPRLVVLDNCEHLVEACARVAAQLLDGCPGARILATSQEPLAVAGERIWHVPPLSLPAAAPDALEPQAPGSDAVGLFVARARAVQPGFALNSYIAGAVGEICTRLDGIALAIELAAAHIERLTPAEIARRLDDRFALLTNGSSSSSSLPRHQTLQAALDWSHDLLSPREQTLLRRLSVFAGGFSLDAAQEVCCGGAIEPADVRDLVAALGSKSLVLSDPRGRHRLLETIRAYGADRLDESGERAATRERHARYHRDVAERAEPELTGPAQTAWLEQLDLEREDMRVAIEWSLSHGRSEWALRLAGALVLFWRVRCHFTEGRELLEAAVAAGRDDGAGLRAKALWGAGFLAMMAGRPEDGIPALEHALEGFRSLGDAQGSARALLILANCKQSFDDPVVPALLDESVALAREAGDSWCLAHALGVAGFEAIRSSRLPTARQLLDECLAVARAAQDQQSLRIGLLGRGSLALVQGDFALAESLLDEALEVARASGEEYAAGTALAYLGELAFARGRYERARELLADALSLIPAASPPGASVAPLLLLGRTAHALGDRAAAQRCFDELASLGLARPALALALGDLAADDGDTARARELFEQALGRSREAGVQRSVAEALHGLGCLALAAGDAPRAAALHGEALALQREIGVAAEIVASIEAIAATTNATGQPRVAARLLDAAAGLRARGGYARRPWERRRHAAEVALVRNANAAAGSGSSLDAGAALTLEEAAELAASVASELAAAAGWDDLTAREREVAVLVADGLSNREIGERLFMSLGTVKTHLSHIFSKLGVSGRTEVAREVWRRRP